MNKDLVELVFIIDKSGSMSGLEEDTVGGINTVIKEQKEKDSNCLVSTVLFNDYSDVVHDRVSLKDIKLMELSDYRPSGCTALIDAIGSSIKYIKKVHKIVRKEDVPARTMFVITTDGMENSSRRFSSKEVKKMIKQQSEKGWEFIFLGANIDSVEVAKNYGIKESRSINYINDSKGNAAKYRGLAKAVKCYVESCSIAEDCFDEVCDDYELRKNK